MSEHKNLQSVDEVNEFIQNHKLTLLYITMPQCSVCHGLRPQIQELIQDYPKIKMNEVDANQVEQVRGQFSVFTAPVLILFVNGKEYLREARIVHTQLLDQKISRIYKKVVD